MAPHDPTPPRSAQELSPETNRRIALGLGVILVVFVGSMTFLFVTLASGCGDAKEVLEMFRTQVRTGKLGAMPQTQADDAEMRKLVVASTGQSVGGYESVSGTSGEWLCIQGSITTPQGSKDLDVLAHRTGSGPWEFAGASLARGCRIKRGGPRFINRLAPRSRRRGAALTPFEIPSR